MNILLINDLIGVRGGGANSLMKTKMILEKNGHKVFLLGEKNGSETVISYFRRWFSIKYYFKTIKYIKKYNIDIVHINSCSVLISPSPIIAAKRMKKRVVMTVRTFYYYCPKTWGVNQNYETCQLGYSTICLFNSCPTWKKGILNFPFRLIKWIKVGFHRYIIRKYVDHFICTSTKMKKFMQRTFELSNEKISHLANFIDIEINFNVDYSKIKSNQFLFVGRISQEKGIDIAIMAVSILLLKKETADIKLKIIGSGKEEEKLKKMIKKMNLEKNIEFLGRIDNDKLYKYYQESIAVLVPSICLEAFGRVNIEAMKNKTPVVACNTGGIPDIIDHGENGYLFKTGDYKEMSKYMKKLYKNVELSKKLGENGFKKVKKEFNEEKYYNNLLKIYINQ